MEKIYQKIGKSGLQIPFPLIQQYGLQVGASVQLEFGIESIRIRPAMVDKLSIEKKALKYLFSNVGDAVSVKVSFDSEDATWCVKVFGAEMNDASGVLYYSSSGALLNNRSMSTTQIRNAIINQ
jgi:antitoxin component of MazEF toxin-antitoxin module